MGYLSLKVYLWTTLAEFKACMGYLSLKVYLWTTLAEFKNNLNKIVIQKA